MVDVLIEDLESERLQRGGDGGDLRDDVDAVTVVGEHVLDAANLPFDSTQPLDQSVLVGGIAVGERKSLTIMRFPCAIGSVLA